MKRNQKNFHVLLKSIFLNICKILIPVEVTRGETVNTAIVDIYDSDEGCDPFLKMRVGSQTLPISFCLQTDHLKQFVFQLCGQVALYTHEQKLKSLNKKSSKLWSETREISVVQMRHNMH